MVLHKEQRSRLIISLTAKHGDTAVASLDLKPAGTAPDITQLLIAWGGGDVAAMEQLAAVLQRELHRVASSHLAAERRGHILQTTALVNEAYLRLIDWKNVRWQNRAQFFGVAANFMRRILVDHARHHYSRKHGGGQLIVSLRDIEAFGAEPDADLLALQDVLERLELLDPNQGRIVELRFFGGLTIKETAEVMQISHATVEREWRLAKAFIKRELTRGNNSS